MTPAEFREQTLAISSASDPAQLDGYHLRLALYGLGIAGEAGEVADEVKKYLFHDKPIDTAKIVKEVGDVLWYADRILMWLGYSTLSDAMQANVDKLRARYPDGWDAAAKHYGWTTPETAG